MTGVRQIALRVPNDQLEDIDADFQRQGLVEWTLKSKDGDKSLTGRTANGTAVRISLYSGNGLTERTASVFRKISPGKRKLEAIRLRKRGLTQSEIAERLGCSQKTISNDLK